MTDNPAAINRPITDDERALMLSLAIRCMADQSDLPHTDGNCPACAVGEAVIGEFGERGEIHLYGDAIDCYMSVGATEEFVHCTREWLAFHAEHPEAIDMDKHRRQIPNARGDEGGA